MATKIHDVIQRSPEWADLRLGRLTGSRFASILNMKTFGLKSKDVCLTMICKMLAEEQTGFSCDSDYISDAMQWGIDSEQEYKEKYLPGRKDVGFITNSKFDFIGLSPDSLSNTGKSAVEIKAPNSEKHIRMIVTDKILPEYIPQLLMYFICIDDLKNLDFVSYDCRNRKTPIFKKNVTRTELKDQLTKSENALKEFETMLNEIKQKS